MVKDTFVFESPDKGPEEFIRLFRTFYGPTMNAFDAAQKNGREEELNGLLVELAKSQNTAGEGRLSIPATFRALP